MVSRSEIRVGADNLIRFWLCRREAAPFVGGFGHQLVIDGPTMSVSLGTTFGRVELG
jgi:hypothetical protein